MIGPWQGEPETLESDPGFSIQAAVPLLLSLVVVMPVQGTHAAELKRAAAQLLLPFMFCLFLSGTVRGTRGQ